MPADFIIRRSQVAPGFGQPFPSTPYTHQMGSILLSCQPSKIGRLTHIPSHPHCKGCFLWICLHCACTINIFFHMNMTISLYNGNVQSQSVHHRSHQQLDQFSHESQKAIPLNRLGICPATSRLIKCCLG